MRQVRAHLHVARAGGNPEAAFLAGESSHCSSPIYLPFLRNGCNFTQNLHKNLVSVGVRLVRSRSGRDGLRCGDGYVSDHFSINHWTPIFVDIFVPQVYSSDISLPPNQGCAFLGGGNHLTLKKNMCVFQIIQKFFVTTQFEVGSSVLAIPYDLSAFGKLRRLGCLLPPRHNT